MSSSNNRAQARNSWKDRLLSLQTELESIHSVDVALPDEQTFREHFYALPAEQHGDAPEHNYPKFIRRHEPVIYLATEIDKTVGLESPDSLSNIFWTCAYITLKVAFEDEYTFDDIAPLYSSLHKEVPSEQGDYTKSPWNLEVQEPLQNIFEAYIRCYLELIKQTTAAATEEREIEFGPVKEAISSANEIYKIQYVVWKERCDKVQNAVREDLNDDDATTNESRFEAIRLLGIGTYGKVQEVRETTTGSIYARKQIAKSMYNQDPKQIEIRVKNEAEIMNKLRHNHIASVNMWFQSDKFFNIIMLPVADCDLHTFLEEHCIAKGYPIDNLRMIEPWFGCLISALSYAHAESIKHEDIKPTNILIKARKVYLTDFGTARDFGDDVSIAGGVVEQGTPTYWAPEQRPWGRPADVFALGCVFAEMFTVRQKKSLADFRRYRYNASKEFGNAFRWSVPKVKRWLKDCNVNRRDEAGIVVLEQTFNMLIEEHAERPEARRIKKQLRVDEALFCDTCGG